MIDELLKQISEAFKDAPRPTNVTKSVARALDDEWNVPEPRREALRNLDHETNWSDLTDDDIEAFDDIFAFLNAEGYRFYLPAFMSYALRRHRDSDSCAINYTINACTFSHDNFALFTSAQMRCVIDFLTFCAVNDRYLDAAHSAYAVDFLEHSPKPPSA